MTRDLLNRFCTFLVLITISGVSNAASFIPLGQLPDGSNSAAYAVSSDGSVIVGNAGVANTGVAFRWTAMGGISAIPDGSDPSYGSSARAVSADGSVIAGRRGSATSIWNAGQGWLELVDDGASEALGISADGLVVVGWSRGPGGNNYAVRWVNPNEAPQALGNLPFAAQFRSHANAASASGAVVVGSATNSGNRDEAFRWSSIGGMVGLGPLNGAQGNSSALGVSSDGSVVVGVWMSDTGDRTAFRWTAGTGMTGLSDLAGGGMDGWATGVSGDGATVIGFGDRGNGREATFWTTESGTVALLDHLLANGAQNAQGWILREARAISIDGRVIVGEAINPQGQQEAFAAVLSVVPLPAAAWLLGGALAALGVLRRRAQ